MRVFISGKVSGLDEAEYKANFAETEKRLKEAGITNIYNPAREIASGTPWGRAMDICYAQIEKSDIVVFMNNWRESLGSRREWEHANRLRKIIRMDTPSDMRDIAVYLNKKQTV